MCRTTSPLTEYQAAAEAQEKYLADLAAEAVAHALSAAGLESLAKGLLAEVYGPACPKCGGEPGHIACALCPATTACGPCNDWAPSFFLAGTEEEVFAPICPDCCRAYESLPPNGVDELPTVRPEVWALLGR